MTNPHLFPKRAVDWRKHVDRALDTIESMSELLAGYDDKLRDAPEREAWANRLQPLLQDLARSMGVSSEAPPDEDRARQMFQRYRERVREQKQQRALGVVTTLAQEAVKTRKQRRKGGRATGSRFPGWQERARALAAELPPNLAEKREAEVLRRLTVEYPGFNLSAKTVRNALGARVESAHLPER